MAIKKRQLLEQLKRFPEIKKYMFTIAAEKVRYHQILIESVIARYRDASQVKSLVKTRLENYRITTYMSLKRELKKKQAALKKESELYSNYNRIERTAAAALELEQQIAGKHAIFSKKIKDPQL